MYNFLFDHPYINIVVFSILLFLVMFLWRKLTILEGNFFLLEKRVNIIKKGERTELLSKNWNNYDKTMNEIFKDSIVKDDSNISNKCCDTDEKVNNKSYNDENDTYDKSYEGDICNTIPVKKEIVINKKTTVEIPVEVNNFIKEEEEDNSVTHITLSNDKSFYDVGDYKDEETVHTNVVEHIDIADNISVSSDITFNNEGDKSSVKKYKMMSLDKLREECIEKMLNTEGTKAQLVTRIVEHIKKQK